MALHHGGWYERLLCVAQWLGGREVLMGGVFPYWPADARDCVFFMHGILDTSMGWVSNGVTGSQAFAAYDQGFDVWLGNSRANPPRVHIGTPAPAPPAMLSLAHAMCSMALVLCLAFWRCADGWEDDVLL